MSKEKFKPGIAGVKSYLTSFQNKDLVSNKFIIQHNLRAEFPQVVVYDGDNKVILPDEITYLDEDRIELDLTSFVAISGVWHTRVIKD